MPTMNPILQAQSNHKSIRQYTDKVIDEALIKQLIRLLLDETIAQKVYVQMLNRYTNQLDQSLLT